MRKRIIGEDHKATAPAEDSWLAVESLAEVEMSSEDPAHPIEAALVPGQSGGWRASAPGRQTIRLHFTQPQALRRICLQFHEEQAERTQEYRLRWSPDGGTSWSEIVRQQWNFSPHGAILEEEEHTVSLSGLTVLELVITPHVGGGDAIASLHSLRLA